MTKKQKILLYKIDSFKEHPFHVNNDESLKELANSIKKWFIYAINSKIKRRWKT